MTPEQFVYWLQGYFELTDQGNGRCNGIDTTQMQIIRDHLKEVFCKKTPDRKPVDPNNITVPFIIKKEYSDKFNPLDQFNQTRIIC